MRRLLPIALAVLAGCGSLPPPDSPPALVLTVTLDGAPAGRLNVQLVAPDGKPAATGGTDDAGRAAIRATGGQPLPPGPYKVVVADLGGAEENPMEPAKGAAKSRVPGVYGRPGSTPLTVTVEAGKTEYGVDLKSKL